MHKLWDLVGWLVLAQILLLVIFEWFGRQALGLTAIWDYSPVYAGFLGLGALLAVHLLIRLLRLTLLQGVGQKSRRAARVRGLAGR